MQIKKDKRAVVWVSVVIYTLIGLSVMAMLLAVIRPKIAEMKDHFIIKQTIDTLNEFDSTIMDIRQTTGNTRLFKMFLSRGEFRLNCLDDRIEWYIKDSGTMFSEPGIPVQMGNIIVITEKRVDLFGVTLRMDYTILDLQFNGKDEDKTLQPADIPYNIWLENKGVVCAKQTIEISVD